MRGWRLEMGVWDWRARLRGRAAGQFNEVLETLHGFTPKENTIDSWIWSPAADGVFTVSCLSKTTTTTVAVPLQFSTVWLKMLPKKVNIFTWRAVNAGATSTSRLGHTNTLPTLFTLHRDGGSYLTRLPFCHHYLVCSVKVV